MVEPEQLLKARILVVDDQQPNVLLLERMLAGAGYTAVSSTLDPRAVCGLHRANRYDLILLDLQMPVMDGFEVLAALQQEGAAPPVLVVTAQPDHKLRALRAGARDFVGKPFDLAEVLLRVRNLLEVRLYASALEQTVQELEKSRAQIRGQSDELGRLFDQVVAERKLSERLALHAPPDSIAARLQARPDVTPESFAEATVLIADVVGFAGLAEAATPGKLPGLLDEVFAVFDGLAAGRGVKKIKTLGNSRLAAAGVPVPAADHAAQAAHLALDLVGAMAQFHERAGAGLQVRIGLASGPLVAGVIGRRMFVYDVWGEAVTVASRMESHGVAGRVQMPDRARRLLRDPFVLEERGKLQVEGLGEIKTWFLTGRGP